ncbi:MAG: NADH:ubiquinone reductase (Na(+)-transporting) subunit A [Halobacteriovorax sp.]|nr:NADH:ubiquinone reductase (Na(+)-transporting) subunit A [Halobacteriovorax sp.]|tara:strand:+ start:20869 stop:22212 length:1344 start_codon:yes stop_codon:yes gene_type:complete
MVHVKKGLDVPVSGEPVQTISPALTTKTVALTGPDYNGMKPSMLVKVGDEVKIGQALFACKKVEGVIYTSPAGGKVTEINRGEKRVFETLVIEVGSEEGHVDFTKYTGKEPKDLNRDEVEGLLVESGLWTALRTRPFSKNPELGSEPHSIFVNAMDTNPLCPDPQVVINDNSGDFKNGVKVLTHLTSGKVHLVKKAGSNIEGPNCNDVNVHEFSGVHPAGNVGTHIHFIDPVHANKIVWSIGYQDVIAIGKLFSTGKLHLERVVSIAGPQVKSPKLVKTRLGANLSDLTAGELKDGENRIISGSLLNGTQVQGPFNYLGRYHNQITVLSEGRDREFLGWQMPGMKKFSVTRAFVGKLFNKKFDMHTNQNGSYRAMVPIGNYEKMMPLDMLPTQLIRALLTHDTDLAQKLGCLELDEEDLALCTFASVGKKDFGPVLRENLIMIEKEG